jgi:uncharacterized protein (TIGR03000 family)
MYSIVLMSALTSSPDAAQFNGFFRNLFSFGGGCYGSCSGRDTSAGYASCNGRPGLFHGRIIEALRPSNGCCGGTSQRPANCSGNANYSCNGGSCSGYTSCQGSYSYGCTGSVAMGCNGNVAFSCSGGIIQGAPIYGNPMPSYPGQNMIPSPGVPTYDGVPYAPNTPTPPASIDERYRISQAAPLATGGASRGTIVVKLPVDAKLFANDRPLNMSGAERTFVTPELPAGGIYSYTFRVEYERQGETVSVGKKVTVSPGETKKVEFIDLILARAEAKPAAPIPVPVPTPVPAAAPGAGNPFKGNAVTTANSAPEKPAAVAGDRAKITVKLPPGATLYIDERRNDQSGNVREFTTPPLPAGKEFAYTMKVEIVRAGLPETVTEKVPVRGGDSLTRDFASAFGR